MGMDGIGGVGALNVSSQTRVTRPQSETVDVNTGSTAGQQQVQVASLPPIGGKGNSNNNGQPGQQQDRGAVQTDQEVAPDKIKAAVDDLNKTVKQASPMHHTQLSFKYHEDTNRIPSPLQIVTPMKLSVRFRRRRHSICLQRHGRWQVFWLMREGRGRYPD